MLRNPSTGTSRMYPKQQSRFLARKPKFPHRSEIADGKHNHLDPDSIMTSQATWNPDAPIDLVQMLGLSHNAFTMRPLRLHWLLLVSLQGIWCTCQGYQTHCLKTTSHFRHGHCSWRVWRAFSSSQKSWMS